MVMMDLCNKRRVTLKGQKMIEKLKKKKWQTSQE